MKIKTAQSHSRRRIASMNIQSWKRPMIRDKGLLSQLSKLRKFVSREPSMDAETRPSLSSWQSRFGRSGTWGASGASFELSRSATTPACSPDRLRRRGEKSSRIRPCYCRSSRLFVCGLYSCMNRTLVVVPTYNERENLPPLAQRLLALPVSVDMLVVDDNSPDGTGKIADELAAKNPSIHVLHRMEKSGLGRAYIDGFKWALENGYEFVFELDGDFSHNPDDIPMFLEAARNAELVLGSRYLNGIRIINWPLSRLMLSKCAATYVRIITGMPFSDPTGGYKCFRRCALEAIDLEAVQSNGYSFQIEMTHKLWRQGLRVVEVPIIFTDRF